MSDTLGTHVGCESQLSRAGFYPAWEDPSITRAGDIVWSCVLARVGVEAENQASDRQEKGKGREGHAQ